MGVASSSEHERHVRNLSDLRFFDVVLMTSEATIRGLGVEDRIAQQIKLSVAGAHTPSVVVMPRYDRVGLIIPPAAVTPDLYTHENVQVLTSTEKGVFLLKLREVFHTSASVVVRAMNIGSEIREEEQRQAQWKQSNYQREEPDEVKVDARAALIEKYHKIVEPILNKSFSDSGSMNAMIPMWEWVLSEVVKFQITEDQEERAKHLITVATQAGATLDFSQLLSSFVALSHDPNIVNTFSNAEIFQLVSNYHDGEGSVAKKVLVDAWTHSARRSAQTVTTLSWPSIVSGGVVCFLLQKCGLLIENWYHSPMSFAEPSVKGYKGDKDEKGGSNRMGMARGRGKAPRQRKMSTTGSAMMTGNTRIILRDAKLGVEQTLPPPPPGLFNISHQNHGGETHTNEDVRKIRHARNFVSSMRNSVIF